LQLIAGNFTNMAGIGSVFLGDVQRHRIFSTSTPPSSPPASSIYTRIPSPPRDDDDDDDDDDNDSVEDDDTETTGEAAAAPPMVDANPPKATTIDPMLALELRLRWLEALVLGLPENNPSRAASHRKLGSVPLRKKLLKHGETLVRLAEDVQSRLDAIVEANEGLKRFMAQCKFFSPLFYVQRSNLHNANDLQMTSTKGHSKQRLNTPT
jgi:hypothetical protein